MLGTTVGSYTIQRELGKGGMGAVYVGTHTLLGRQAAIKVLLPELSRNQDIVNRFFHEAKAATSIRHAGIVEVYDFGYAADGSAFIVMEMLAGESLTSRLARMGRLPASQALAIARQMSGALAAAHRIGIVHRDLKPDNVFLVPDLDVAGGERAKLLDFGIAKLSGSLQQTQANAVMGTPTYMAPEQCRGAAGVDHRTDLYALGCMLFEMVTGRVPYDGMLAEILGAHLHAPVPSPRALAPDLPVEVERLIVRLMAKSADERPASADALIGEIGALLGLPPGGTAPQLSGNVMVPGSPTTIGGAAASHTVRPTRSGGGSRLGLWIGGGVVAIAGVAVAVVLASGGGEAATGAAVGPAIDGGVVATAPEVAPDAGAGVGVAPAGGAAVEAAGLAERGKAAVIDRRFAEASELYAKAITLDPQAKYFIDLAIAKYSEGKLGEALTAVDGAKDLAMTAKQAQVRTELRARILDEMKRQGLGVPAGTERPATEDHKPAGTGPVGGTTPVGGKPASVDAGVPAIVAEPEPAPAPTPIAKAPPPPGDEGSPAERAKVLAEQGKEASLDGLDDRAVTLFRQAIQLDPRAQYYFFLGIALNQSGKLGEALAAVDAASRRNPDARLADKIATMRTNLVKEMRAQGMTPPPPPKGSVSTAKPAEPSSSGGGDLETSLQAARNAAKSSQWGKALVKSREVLAIDASHVEALTIGAMAACNLKNASTARDYIGRLPAARADLARQSCLRNNITID